MFFFSASSLSDASTVNIFYWIFATDFPASSTSATACSLPQPPVLMLPLQTPVREKLLSSSLLSPLLLSLFCSFSVFYSSLLLSHALSPSVFSLSLPLSLSLSVPVLSSPPSLAFPWRLHCRYRPPHRRYCLHHLCRSRPGLSSDHSLWSRC
jgi:hypothetical protein